MDFCDVVFPVNLGALTYHCPEGLSAVIKPGMIVSAPLKNSITRGIVIRKASRKHPGTVKDITEVHNTTPVLSSSLIRLLDWMADYYVAEQGLILKNILPKELLTKERIRKPRGERSHLIKNLSAVANNVAAVPVDIAMVDTVKVSMHNSAYGTFLLHAPSSAYAQSFVLNTVVDARNGIILVPEISGLMPLYALLKQRLGERICLFHSELSKGQRREAFERILSSQSDIVLGTRSAVFSPLKKVSFIAVLQEQSTSYKQESSPCYNGRDIAVMRAFFEKATVLLTSISPSVESFFNCKQGKYRLLKPASQARKLHVRVIDMRYEPHIKPYLSKAVIDSAKKYLSGDGKILLVINRRGHSTLLECPDCNYVAECPNCKIPLVYHKQDMSMQCHFCGYKQSKAPEVCSRCRGHNLKLLGAGTQKVEEDIQHILGVGSLRLDSDSIKGKSSMRTFMDHAGTNEQRILLGTKMLTRRLNADIRVSMAAILNADHFLNLPDFRSAEKTYHEIVSAADKVAPGGEILIQTRMPQHDVFKALKTNIADGFFREELRRRKSLLYPPFSRLILIKCISKNDLTKEIMENVKSPGEDVEILGPSLSKNKKEEYECRLLLKSPNRGQLHAAARSITAFFENKRGIEVKVDVDPQVI